MKIDVRVLDEEICKKCIFREVEQRGRIDSFDDDYVCEDIEKCEYILGLFGVKVGEENG